MDPDRSVGVEGGRKPFYVVPMVTERKWCDCTDLPQIAYMQIYYTCAQGTRGTTQGTRDMHVHIGVRRRMPYRTEHAPFPSIRPV